MASDIITGISSSSQLERKMHLKGTVIKTNKAGAIIDIGVEKPALLHVSQIIIENKQPILRVEDFLKIGQEVDVYVRNIQNDRIEITMKEPLSLEWREIKKDMVVKGKVSKLENFGAFVDIGAECLGLVHVSELTHGYVRDASEIISAGDEIEAKIIDFNRRRKQIKLSMKAMQPSLDEIEGVKFTPARPKRKNIKGKSKKEKTSENNEVSEEKEPTVMEIALREAMEKASVDQPAEDTRSKKLKNISKEQGDILSRTLKQRT
jgi:predicted RNA-binding protein with RPS1 domain